MKIVFPVNIFSVKKKKSKYKNLYTSPSAHRLMDLQCLGDTTSKQVKQYRSPTKKKLYSKDIVKRDHNFIYFIIEYYMVIVRQIWVKLFIWTIFQ